jgi:hypothetical protein
MRELNPEDITVALGQQPQHCGEPAEPVGDGIWECAKQDAYRYDDGNDAEGWKDMR